MHTLQDGAVCWNHRNPGGMCKDYVVQYIHPCKAEVDEVEAQLEEAQDMEDQVETSEEEYDPEHDLEEFLFSQLNEKK